MSGKTLVDVNNTNAGPGVFNQAGIPVVYVDGNVRGDAFALSKPIDTGLFNYDLFFAPTGSGIFELKSFLGEAPSSCRSSSPRLRTCGMRARTPGSTAPPTCAYS